MSDPLITSRTINSIPVSVFTRFVLTEDSIMGGSTPFETNGKFVKVKFENQENNLDMGFSSSSQNNNNSFLNENQEYRFTHVFEETIDPKNFFQQVLDPLTNEFVNGINCNVFLVGSKDCKIEKIVQNSLISNFSFSLFKKLKSLKQNEEFQVFCSGYRIFNDTIGDLLFSQSTEKEFIKNQKLNFGYNEIQGLTVNPYLTRLEVLDTEQLLKCFQLSKKSEISQQHQFNFQISSRSVYIYEIQLFQVLSNPSNNQKQKLFSKFKFFEFHGIEYLFDNNINFLSSSSSSSSNNNNSFEDQRNKNTNKNKNSLSIEISKNDCTLEYLKDFYTLLRKLIICPQIPEDFVKEYNYSKITKSLKECFGGNSLTSTILFVNRQEKNNQYSSKLFSFFSSFQCIHNFPIVNDDLSLGCIGGFLSELNYFQNISNYFKLINNNNKNKLFKIEEHQSDKNVKFQLEYLKIIQQKSKIEKDYIDLKAKYFQILRKHNHLKETFKSSEIERIKYFEMLMKIENLIGTKTSLNLLSNNESNKNKSSSSSDNNNNNNTSMETLESILKKLIEQQSEKKQVLMEYVNLKKTFSKLKTEYNEMKMKNDKLNIELLKLIKLNLQNSRNKKVIEKEEFINKLKSIQLENNLMKKDLSSNLVELTNLKNDKERLNLEIEHMKIEHEKVKFSKKSEKKDEELISLKMQVRKLKFEKNQQHIFIKQLKDQQTEKHQIEKELNEKLYNFEKDHRVKLKSFIAKFEELNEIKRKKNSKEVKNEEEEEENGNKEFIEKEQNELFLILENIKSTISEMTSDLIGSYENKELENFKKLERIRENNNDLHNERNYLLEKYVELKLTFLSRIESSENIFSELLISDKELENLKEVSQKYRDTQSVENFENQTKVENLNSLISKLKKQHLESSQEYESNCLNLQSKYMALLSNYSNLQKSLLQMNKNSSSNESSEHNKEVLSKHLKEIELKMISEVKQMKNQNDNNENLKSQILELENDLNEKNRLIGQLRKEKENLEDLFNEEKVVLSKNSEKIKHLEKHYKIIKKKYLVVNEKNKNLLKLKNKFEDLKDLSKIMKKENDLLQSIVNNKEKDQISSEINSKFLRMKHELTSQLNKYRVENRFNKEQLKLLEKKLYSKSNNYKQQQQQNYNIKKPNLQKIPNFENMNITSDPSKIDRIVLDNTRNDEGTRNKNKMEVLTHGIRSSNSNINNSSVISKKSSFKKRKREGVRSNNNLSRGGISRRSASGRSGITKSNKVQSGKSERSNVGSTYPGEDDNLEN